MNSLEMTLKAVEEFKPERIAFYSYAHVPMDKTYATVIFRCRSSTPEQKLEFFLYAQENF